MSPENAKELVMRIYPRARPYWWKRNGKKTSVAIRAVNDRVSSWATNIGYSRKTENDAWISAFEQMREGGILF